MLSCLKHNSRSIAFTKTACCWGYRSASSNTASDPFGDPPSLPLRRVVVTGLGLVTPLGVGVTSVWQRLLAGETGVSKLTPDHLPESHRESYTDLASKVAACVPQDKLDSAPWAVQADRRRQARFVSYASCAASEALQDAEWHPDLPAGKAATGVAIGAGMSSTQDIAEAGILLSQGKLRRLNPFFVPKILVNMAAGAVSIHHGFQGPNHAASTACTTGAHSVGDAFRMIRHGDADVMVCGGTESCIDAVSIGGFSRMKALSTRFNDAPHLASRPFDRDRDGFVIGEGAGVLVLEEMQHALARRVRIYAEVRGYGLSGDAHHITQPAPDGIGARLAMRRAMQAAGACPQDITYINAHATSTPLGDTVEQKAIAAVFGTRAMDQSLHKEEQVAVSSTKGATGHLLGAAGSVEAIFAILALRGAAAPPTVNLMSPDAEILANIVAGKAQQLCTGPAMVMTNSFGFGGTNASLVFATPPVL